MKKYLSMSSAAVVIGALRVKGKALLHWKGGKNENIRVASPGSVSKFEQDENTNQLLEEL